NPKYYLNTEENLIYRRFVRKDKLGLHDKEIHNLLSKDWWYTNPRKSSINFWNMIKDAGACSGKKAGIYE
ncbi:20018_t:CDS:2, partial [Gigaspora margarita]